MKNLSLLKYFTFYSAIAFLFTGFFLIFFINDHMINDQINAIEEITHVSIDYIVEPELSPSD